jgi:hypothetical protein
MGKLKQKISIFLSVITLLAPILISVTPAKAVSSADFVNGGLLNNLISNTDFLDVNSMSESEIQNFLNNNNSYLKDYSENGRSAAQIIHESAHGLYDAGGSLNGITINESTGTVSPKVLLVMLEKEQSLVRRTTRNDWAMLASLGYYCYPGVIGDNNDNGCKDSFEGFTKQVENGAWQLRYNYERAQGKGLDYQVGQVFNTSDGYAVTLINAATSSLYRYTPYVFYGNYNFYNFFTGWFSTHIDAETNDTTKFTLKTYETSQVISGQKASTSIAYLDGQQIAGSGTKSWEIALTNIATGTNEHTITYKDSGGTVLGTKQIIIVVQKAGDVNGDGTVEIQDLSIFANYWNQTNPEEPLADLNGDHVINIQDLSILAGYWGS